MIEVKWKKISNYCIEHNHIYISKYNIMDGQRFAMWHNTKLIKIFNTAKEAKDHAISLIKTINANADIGIKSVTRKKSTITDYN